MKQLLVFLLSIAILNNCNKPESGNPTENPQDTTGQTDPQDTISDDTTEVISYEKKYYATLGSTEVTLAYIVHGDIPVVYFNMHENETTSIEAGKELLTTNYGKMLAVQSAGNREVSFTYSGKNYSFDPNRIFTLAGAEATLRNYGNYSVEARNITYDFAMMLVDSFLIGEKLIVTLHNNTGGGYSAESYLPNGAYASDNAIVHIVSGADTDDFYYVTEQRFYDFLSAKGYNIVLQNNNQVIDDGSLSVFCGMKNISYINVEAQVGHYTQQLQMLEELQPLIQEMVLKD